MQIEWIGVNGEAPGAQTYVLSAIVPKGLEAKGNFLFEAKVPWRAGHSGICWLWHPCRPGLHWQKAAC